MDFESTLDGNMGTELELSGEVKGYLKEAAKWAKFLGIVGFVYLGLIIIMLVGFGSIFSMFAGNANMGGGDESTATYIGMFFYFALIFAMIFFPSYFSYLFGSKMQTALENESNTDIAESFKNLKSNYKFWGILTLINIIISILSILISFAMGIAFM